MTTRALVVHPALRSAVSSKRSPQASLEEAVGLAEAIGVEVAHRELITLSRVKPATLLGGGTLARLAAVIAEEEIALTLVDHALTPIQQRNLERALDCKVIDRTGLILEIFGARARTREGQLQVELAALTYQRSRLVRSWTHLERQRGGFGFLGGPGESQLEIDRRLITERITRLKADLEQTKRTRALHRRARRKVPFPVVALVGYTNAGKSTLFNRLTRADVVAEDMLFATLDPTMRRVRTPAGRDIILSDTVGFVSELPTDLVAAFRATLEEVRAADLIVHVRDISHVDSEAQRADVEAVLSELDLDQKLSRNLIEVHNKVDLLEPEDRQAFQLKSQRRDNTVFCSALTGEGLEDLLALLDKELAKRGRTVDINLPLCAGAAMAWLYSHGEVIERRDEDLKGHLTVRLDPSDVERFRRRYGREAELVEH